MRDHTVSVWGEPQKVAIDQKSKSVWIAVGVYMGQRIEVKSRSAGSALKLWKDAATYRGN